MKLINAHVGFWEKCAVCVCDMQNINKVSWNCCESETHIFDGDEALKFQVLISNTWFCKFAFFSPFILENITQHQTAFSLILISKQTFQASGGKFLRENSITFIDMFRILKLTHTTEMKLPWYENVFCMFWAL